MNVVAVVLDRRSTIKALRHPTASQRGFFFILPSALLSKVAMGSVLNQFTLCAPRRLTTLIKTAIELLLASNSSRGQLRQENCVDFDSMTSVKM